MMTITFVPRLVLTISLAALLTAGVIACSGGSDIAPVDATPTSSSKPIVSTPTGTTPSLGRTPTATSVPGLAITRQTSPLIETSDGELRYNGDVVEFEYSKSWRISDRTANSVSFTHVSAPGDALITVHWEPGVTAEVVSQYMARLELFAADIIQLENTVIDGESAARTLIVGPSLENQTPNLVLAVVAIKGGMGVIVAFAAPTGLFETLAADADEFISAIRIR